MDKVRYPPMLGPSAVGALFAGATLLAFASTLQAAAALGYQGEEVPWTGLLKARLVGWYLCALLVPFLVWLVRIRPIDRSGWRSALPLHAGSMSTTAG